jgi:60 kDa SS-A/Ro ribonucleoprotein
MSISKLLEHFQPDRTPPSEAVPGKPMVPNSAGGFTFAVDDWTRLDRFLILGTEGGTYYTGERALTLANAECVRRCALADGLRAIARIVEISKSGRAPKNAPAIFALAVASEVGSVDTKTAAYRAVSDVCRTGTHLFEFAAAKRVLGGAFGAGMRRAVGRWYTERTPGDLAYQVIKYRNRADFTHRDLLRLARPKGTPETDAILRWCVRGREGLGEVVKAPGRESRQPERHYAAAGELPALILAFDELQAKAAVEHGLSVRDAVKFVVEHRLPWECLPSESLVHGEVWEALLPNLPMTATLRNLATMTRAGVLGANSTGQRIVQDRLANAEQLRRARLHPLSVLTALRTYAAGRGLKSDKTWEPNPRIVDALDAAFYAAFESAPRSGKRWLLGLDVSGSMGCGALAGSPLTPRDASAALALVTLAVEPSCAVMGFSTKFTPLPLTPKMRLESAIAAISGLPFEGTDCALPMLYAAENKIPVDVFAVYTDNETWAGKIHPFVALKKYREKMGIPAKLAVVGMTATEFSIADPSDAGMLDVVGFDTATPSLLSWFAGANADRNVEDE